MIRIILIYFIFIIQINAEDNLIAQKQNALYVQNLIEIEENIAKNFEKYILTEFKFPASIDDLITDEYLGSNFSKLNRMGANIDFKDITNLKIKYAVTKEEYRKKVDTLATEDNYIVQLYNRDLYRNKTVAYAASDILNSYVEIELQSLEAKNIYNLLKDGNVIEKNCVANIVSKYCNLNDISIRWYTSNSDWIEYNKKNLKGNVSTSITVGNSGINLSNEAKIIALPVGTYIISNSIKYVKMHNPSNTFLKVE